MTSTLDNQPDAVVSSKVHTFLDVLPGGCINDVDGKLV